MSYYVNEDNWSTSGRQPSWEHQAPPSRSGTGSAISQQSDGNAFAFQFEEIERATDNLMKSGKWLPGSVGGASRRESATNASRSFDYNSSDPRLGGGPSRHSSMSEHDGGRPGSAGLQGFYAGQRFPPRSGQSEAEQMLQAKRRMAAQRERELRNYHQEQQYNRSMRGSPSSSASTANVDRTEGVKTDRAMSPNAMSEEDRRELIARQHRALYGDNSSIYGQDGSNPRQPQSQDARISSASGRVQSPQAFDSYPSQAQSGAEDAGAVQMPSRDRTESVASPVSTAMSSQSQTQSFNLLNEQSSRTSNSSPGASPPLTSNQNQGRSQQQQQQQQKGGVAPIGTRPSPATSQVPTGGAHLNKRSTTPLTPSSLSYGYSSGDAQGVSEGQKDDRSTSASSNAGLVEKGGVSGLGGWGGSSTGVWGSGKNSLQASVWG